MDRVIARFTGAVPGPTLIGVGGVHGNEPAGVIALKQVSAELEHRGGLARGAFLALLGNRAAFAARVRFVERDLNREWSHDTVGAATTASTVEDRERAEVHAAITVAAAETVGDVYVLDLHTMSGPGRPFTVFADTLRSRAFANRFPNPLILGLEEHLNGTLLDYYASRGYQTAAFEGGQHDDPASVDNLRSAIWVALGTAGLLDASLAPRVRRARTQLKQAVAGLPSVLEVRERYEIHPDERFQMVEGFSSFDRVRAGQVVAYNRHGPVVASSDAYLLMPLYQHQGNDGYFLAAPVKRFWLWISRFVRAIGIPRLARWLPGVHRDPDHADVLVVDRRIARFVALNVFHLAGYRRLSDDGRRLRVQRRPE